MDCASAWALRGRAQLATPKNGSCVDEADLFVAFVGRGQGLHLPRELRGAPLRRLLFGLQLEQVF